MSRRDVLVTGMGFCLPGPTSPVFTADELWDVAVNGRTCLTRSDGGVYYGAVGLPHTTFGERLPDVPGVFAERFTAAHRYGLLSMVEACSDAGLDFRAGDLVDAAILAARGGVDANVNNYISMLGLDPEAVSISEATGLFIETALAVSPSDVALAQSALCRSTGPSFTVACGCSSSSAQLSNARFMIAAGDIDVAVVSGVDTLSVEFLRKLFRLAQMVQELDAADQPTVLPDQPLEFDRIMRPYDRRAACVNYGEGSVTLILESREHAERRGAEPYGRILAQAITRDGLPHPLASDHSGAGLVAAVHKCLEGRLDVTDVPYIHGGSDGGMATLEANAIRRLYGPAAADLLMTSQEGCFGHNGAPTGALGVALTLLMMRHGAVCPTANCEEPMPDLPFDPVPGVLARPLDFDHALSFTYQLGGLQSSILLGRAA
jgi:3-oxoacyl-[acyl-carrier-protein] synthase II